MKRALVLIAMTLAVVTASFASSQTSPVLASITVTTDPSVPSSQNVAFNPSTKVYYISLLQDSDAVTIQASPADNTTTVSGAVKDATLYVGENYFPIETIAADGSKDSYMIVINEPLQADNE
jgi:hypothetical protein